MIQFFQSTSVLFILNGLSHGKENFHFKFARTRIWKFIVNSLKYLKKEDVESMMCFVVSCKRHVDYIKFAKPQILHVYKHSLSISYCLH